MTMHYQFINGCNNTALFGQGRKRYRDAVHPVLRKSAAARPSLPFEDKCLEIGGQNDEMKEVLDAYQSGSQNRDVLTDIRLTKCIRHSATPSHRSARNVQQQISRLHGGSRHSSMGRLIDIGNVLKAQAIVVDILRTKEGNTCFLVS